MAKNGNLNAAKAARNDEFYTQLTDIEKELVHYRDHFRGRIVFCNCDDPAYSNFWRYFHAHLSETSDVTKNVSAIYRNEVLRHLD